MNYLWLLPLVVFCGVFGQLSLKKGLMRFDKLKASIFGIVKLVLGFDFYITIGILLYIVGMVIWLLLLSNVELSKAFPMIAINYFFIAVFSKVWFKENVGKFRWLGISLIIIGVIALAFS